MSGRGNRTATPSPSRNRFSAAVITAVTLLTFALLSPAVGEELALGGTVKDPYAEAAKCGGGGGICMDVFMAADAWSMKADDSDNNNFGFRTGVNTSFGGEGIRGQLGGSFGLYDLYGREDGLGQSEQEAETQTFVTAGVFKRADLCCGERVSWAIVWDYMSGHNWGENADAVDLHQLRFLTGYALSQHYEVGVWGAVGLNDDIAPGLIGSPLVTPMNQFSMYLRRNWDFGGETMLYVGGADDRYDLGQFVVGFNGRVPLDCRTSLFGGFHYVLPSTSPGDLEPNGVQNSYAEETWNVSCGVVWSFGPGCESRRISPLLPVANNGWFSVAAPTGGL